MTPRPVTETPISAEVEPKARLVWIEPEVDSLTLEQTEFGHGMGHDSVRPGTPDCTKS
jgi:hypothetical protein